jgi:hypothetical protein
MDVQIQHTTAALNQSDGTGVGRERYNLLGDVANQSR